MLFWVTWGFRVRKLLSAECRTTKPLYFDFHTAAMFVQLSQQAAKLDWHYFRRLSTIHFRKLVYLLRKNATYLELRPLDGNISRNSITQFNNNSTQQEPLIVLLIHWKILGRNSLNISYCNKTMMWFDTSAVAFAPSLTFFISVVTVTFGSGPSVTVALAVSWNKTSQMKDGIYSRIDESEIERVRAAKVSEISDIKTTSA